jgi:hypothetical protein
MGMGTAYGVYGKKITSRNRWRESHKGDILATLVRWMTTVKYENGTFVEGGEG